MGEFSRTCAFSRVAIEEGDPVFYISYPENRDKNVYDLKTYIRYDIERANSEFGRDLSPSVLSGFGKYDGYGGVEELEDDESRTIIMIHESVARSLHKYGDSMIKREWSHLTEAQRNGLRESVAYCVALVASLTRTELFGYELLGRQYPDSEEIKEMITGHLISLRMLFYKALDIYKKELSYKNWSFWIGIKYKILKFLGKR
jgi:hypothetical protein